MSSGPDLNLLNWLLASIPVLVLVGTIMGLRWSAPRAGGLAWLIAAGLAVATFGGSADNVAVASAKGLSLALFVLTILWASVYMFNLVDLLKGIEAIGRTMTRIAGDDLTMALLIGWGFASFIQGITGFGVPVAVAAPLLVMAGFPPARAAAIVLVGHGWAVTFGSMGSSYYTIQLVTNIPGEIIGPHMAMLFALPTIVSGAMVAHIQGGKAAVARSLPIVLVVGVAMSAAMWVLATLGAPQIASSVPGMIAIGGITWLSRTPLMRRPVAVPAERSASESPRDGDAADRPMSFHMGFLPYYLLITLSVLSQIGPIKGAVSGLSVGFDYPAMSTNLGFIAPAVENYAPIRLLNHPAPLILMSVAATMVVFAIVGRWQRGIGWEALRLTYNQSLATTVGVATMVMMAVVMADTGMTTLLALGLAQASGPIFPLVAPFIGLLGSFMTGSNTNSNVMFGILQVETARALGMGTVTIASIQSIGASVGSSMAPAKVLVGATLVGLSGRENEIMRLIIPYILGLVLLAGIEAMLLITLLPGWAK